MNSRTRFTKNVFMVLAGMIICLAITLPVSGQLSLVSSFPTNGATGVDISATIELVFSSALDTTARYEGPSGSYLGLFLNPDSLNDEPDSIIISDDLKTLRFYNIHMWPDTRYVLAVMGAKDLTGQSLNHPVVITFSTGALLPAAKIEGTVSYSGENPSGAMIGLFRSLFSDDNPSAAGVVSDQTGDYTVNYVPAGTYWPAAMKDLNGSGAFDPEPGIDVVALYDPDSDGFGDSLVVAEGQSLADINFTLSPMGQITARKRFSQIETKALSWASDAALVSLMASEDVSLDGESSYWIYLFYSQNLSAYSGYLASGAFLGMFTEWDELPEEATPIPQSWADSDVAVDSAEVHGGAAFRASHPDALIMAMLGVFGGDDSSDPPPAQKVSGWRQVAPRLQNISPGKTSGLPNSPCGTQQQDSFWIVMYSDEGSGDFFVVFLDPVTAEFTMSFPPPPTTARQNLDAANQAASAWSSDAVLRLVIGGDMMVPQGWVTIWSFMYYSSSLQSSVSIQAGGGMVLGQESFPHGFPSEESLPQNWVDSPQVIALCETNGGTLYRNSNSDIQVDTWLSKGLYPAERSTPVWWIQYSSSTAPILEFFVDAASGSLITDVEERDVSGEVPLSYMLGQNYPNPFNPQTSIAYDVKEAGRVVIMVYDIQGRMILTPVDVFQQPGFYTVKVDASPWASGIYFYQIRVNEFSAVKKMLLMR